MENKEYLNDVFGTVKHNFHKVINTKIEAGIEVIKCTNYLKKRQAYLTDLISSTKTNY